MKFRSSLMNNFVDNGLQTSIQSTPIIDKIGRLSIEKNRNGLADISEREKEDGEEEESPGKNPNHDDLQIPSDIESGQKTFIKSV